MKTVVWETLSDSQKEAVLERPAISDGAAIGDAVIDVINLVIR